MLEIFELFLIEFFKLRDVCAKRYKRVFTVGGSFVFFSFAQYKHMFGLRWFDKVGLDCFVYFFNYLLHLCIIVCFICFFYVVCTFKCLTQF